MITLPTIRCHTLVRLKRFMLFVPEDVRIVFPGPKIVIPVSFEPRKSPEPTPGIGCGPIPENRTNVVDLTSAAAFFTLQLA